MVGGNAIPNATSICRCTSCGKYARCTATCNMCNPTTSAPMITAPATFYPAYTIKKGGGAIALAGTALLKI